MLDILVFIAKALQQFTRISTYTHAHTWCDLIKRMEKCSTNFVPSQKLCAPWFCMNMRSSIRKVLATCSVTDIGTSIPNHNYKMNLARVTSRWNWCFVIIIALSTTLNFTHRFHFSIYKVATTISGIIANDSRAFFSKLNRNCCRCQLSLRFFHDTHSRIIWPFYTKS